MYVYQTINTNNSITQLEDVVGFNYLVWYMYLGKIKKKQHQIYIYIYNPT